MQAKTEWDSLPASQQTFDSYYNRFSSSWSTFKTLTNNPTNQGANYRIGNANTSHDNNTFQRGGRGGRNGGRHGRFGRGRRRDGQRGRGRGRGRSSSTYNPYQLVRRYGTFTPQAKIYQAQEWRSLTHEQRNEVAQLEANAGWTDGNTPPPGFQVNTAGFAEPSHNMVNAVHSIIGAASIAPTLLPTPHTAMVTLPPPPPPAPTNPPIPPVINTNTNHAGQNFGRRGVRTPSSNDSASVGMVSTIQGQPYTGALFDSNGNRLA